MSVLRKTKLIDTYDLRNSIKQPTCYKNSENSSCIDLMLTNAPRSFYSTYVLETGLSVFRLITLTVLRKVYKKFQSIKRNFRENILHNLSKVNLVNNADDFQTFCDIGFKTLNKHAPYKKKHA